MGIHPMKLMEIRDVDVVEGVVQVVKVWHIENLLVVSRKLQAVMLVDLPVV